MIVTFELEVRTGDPDYPDAIIGECSCGNRLEWRPLGEGGSSTVVLAAWLFNHSRCPDGDSDGG